VATAKTERLELRYYCWKCLRIFHLKAVEWVDEKKKESAEDWLMKAQVKYCPACGEKVFSL